MPYIGKPQSADPITVNTSNIDDGTIQAVDISSSFREHISGSFTAGFEHTGKISCMDYLGLCMLHISLIPSP